MNECKRVNVCECICEKEIIDRERKENKRKIRPNKQENQAEKKT